MGQNYPNTLFGRNEGTRVSCLTSEYGFLPDRSAATFYAGNIVERHGGRQSREETRKGEGDGAKAHSETKGDYETKETQEADRRKEVDVQMEQKERKEITVLTDVQVPNL